MKMKKILTLAATFTLAFSITACGGNSGTPAAEAPAENPPATETPAENTETVELKPEEGAKLVVWESRDERAYTDEIAKEFTEKYGVEVTIEELSPTDQVTKLAQDGPSGLAADIVLFPHDNLGKAVTTNLVLPNDVFEEKQRAVTRKQRSKVSATTACCTDTRVRLKLT